MTSNTLFFSLLTALILILPPSVHAQNIMAGSGKQEITPAAGTPLGGFGKRHGKPSTGVHDALYARALALEHDGQTFIFVSTDLVFIDAELREAVLKNIRARFQIKDEQLLLTATHTHSGSGAFGSRLWHRFILGKNQNKIFQELAKNIAAAVIQSLESQTPAEAEMAETSINQLVENRMDPNLNYPQKMRVLRFKTPEGRTAGVLIFMAAHPTLLSASNMSFSADFPGVLCGTLEKKFPGSAALFMNGAAGDLKPLAPVTEDRLEKMRLYGGQLAEIYEQLSFSPAPVNGTWKSSFENKKLPRVKARIGKMPAPSFLGDRVFARKSFIQTIRMGGILVFGFPGELGSEPGREIENHLTARGFTPFIAGYANDYIAYVISPRHYRDLSQYEAQVSFYGQKMSWWVQEQAIQSAEELMTEDEKKRIRPEGTLSFNEGMPVLKLRGDAYHLGYEEGRLLKNEIHKEIDDITKYLKSELPVPFASALLIHPSMDRAWKKMEPYASYEDYLHIKGLADGAGISFKTMKRMHALPEIYPSWCTNGAYWGKATQDGRMIAIRNLDWNRKIGIHRYATVKYIETSGRQGYANIGYAGFSGVLSGMNAAGISVGQIGASSTDETMEGTPMPFLLKQVLQDSAGLKDAQAVFERSARTRGYNYVIASAVEKKAMVIETTRSHLAVFQDNDEKENAGYALRVPCAVFRGDPALDSAIRNTQTASGGNPEKEGLETPTGSAHEIRYLKHGKLVQEHYGKITPEIAMKIADEIAPGSNIQSIVYAFPEFWTANAKENLKATESGYHHFNIEELKS